MPKNAFFAAVGAFVAMCAVTVGTGIGAATPSDDNDPASPPPTTTTATTQGNPWHG